MDVLRLPTLLSELPTERTHLLDNLGRVRREVGPITPELSDAIADHMGIRRGEVHEVVSFYSFLQVPTSVHRVCTGPVCDCLGSATSCLRGSRAPSRCRASGIATSPPSPRTATRSFRAATTGR